MRIKNPIVSKGTHRYDGPPTRKTFQMVRRHTNPVLSRYHELWNEMHSGRVTTQSLFDNWLERVPSKDCGCREWLRRYIAKNEPRFDDMAMYGWQLHNSVNEKLDKPQFSWEDFNATWKRWKAVDGLRIGFLAGCFEEFGGTETFHETLVPRLPGVIGFATEHSMRGDPSRLGVPTASGESAIMSLVAQSDVIVSWSIDWRDRVRPKRLITVHHGSPSDVWETDRALQGDVIVAVSEETASVMRGLTVRPVYHIPNAVDPLRLLPRNSVETNGKKICLWPHRWSPEKRPKLAIAIAEYLPADWHMVLTGYRGEFPCDSNDKVTILPPQRTGDWLAVSSCVLCTSTTDGYNLTIAEARTAGVPVVSTPVGIASQPGIAITVPIDAIPSEWAEAIVSSEHQELPPANLFSLHDHIAAWSEVVSAET